MCEIGSESVTFVLLALRLTHDVLLSSQTYSCAAVLQEPGSPGSCGEATGTILAHLQAAQVLFAVLCHGDQEQVSYSPW